MVIIWLMMANNDNTLPPLKNDGVRQWVSDDIPYMKWKIKHVPNHQPDEFVSISSSYSSILPWIEIFYAIDLSPIKVMRQLDFTIGASTSGSQSEGVRCGQFQCGTNVQNSSLMPVIVDIKNMRNFKPLPCWPQL